MLFKRVNGPPGSQGPSRLFAAAISGDGAGPSNVPQVPDQPPSKPQPPSDPLPSGPPPPPPIPQRWAPPRYPPPPGPPDPPAPWVLDAANLRPKISSTHQTPMFPVTIRIGRNEYSALITIGGHERRNSEGAK